MGIVGDERADKEAKAAAESGIVIHNKVEHNQLSSYLRNTYNYLDKEFLNSSNVRAEKSFFDNFAHFNIKFFGKLSLIRRESSKIIRLVAGYSFTGHYLHRIGLRESPECECRNSDQDINHIFLQCRLLENQRSLLFNSLIKLRVFPPYSMIYLLSILDDNIAKLLLKFLHGTDLNL